jgi:hypothetical protein
MLSSRVRHACARQCEIDVHAGWVSPAALPHHASSLTDYHPKPYAVDREGLVESRSSHSNQRSE